MPFFRLATCCQILVGLRVCELYAVCKADAVKKHLPDFAAGLLPRSDWYEVVRNVQSSYTSVPKPILPQLRGKISFKIKRSTKQKTIFFIKTYAKAIFCTKRTLKMSLCCNTPGSAPKNSFQSFQAASRRQLRRWNRGLRDSYQRPVCHFLCEVFQSKC